MGRPKHQFWIGFVEVEHAKDIKKKGAKCRKCKFIEWNTSVRRLRDHKCENHGHKPPNQVTLTSEKNLTEDLPTTSDAASEIIDVNEYSQNSSNSAISEPSKKRLRLENFVDTVNGDDQAKMEKVLSMFLFSEEISPNVLRNKFFIEFCKKLKPAFRIPSIEQVNNDILDSVYYQMIENSKAIELQEGIFLFDQFDEEHVSGFL